MWSRDQTRQISRRALSLALSLALFACTGNSQPVTLASARQVVSKYCVTCHSPSGAAADFDWSDERSLMLHRRNIAAKVSRNSMPPSGLPQPDAEERRILLCWAASNDAACPR